MSKDPELKCPMTGEPVRIIETKSGTFGSRGFVGRVESEHGGYSTCIFEHREQLLDFFRRRDGVLKGRPRYNPPKIQVKESEPSAEGLEKEWKDQERVTNDEAQAGAERIMRIVRG
jgi:hypothetical protein